MKRASGSIATLTDGGDARQRTLMADVYGRLRREVLDGVLKPGSRLRFDEMRARYGVGISPLREALTRLAAEKLVTLEEHKGFRVSPISSNDLRDILFMRKEIEAMGIRLSIAKGDDRWEAGIVAALHELGKRRSVGVDGRMDTEWEERHRTYHFSLVSCCGSPRLLQIRELLTDQSDRYRRLSHTYPTEKRDHLTEHTELADAVVARDADAAVFLIRRHLDRTVQILMAEREAADWFE